MRPYIILKWAETQDGFMARLDYTSKWISSEESRKLVHRWRSEVDAVLVGAKTAIVDNPSLTVRLYEPTIPNVAFRTPLRVALLPRGTLPSNHNLMNSEAKTLLITSRDNIQKELSDQILNEAIEYDRHYPEKVISVLKDYQIMSLMIEGGSKTIEDFIAANLWDEARIFKSPIHFNVGIDSPKLLATLKSSTSISEDTLLVFQREDN